MKRLLDELKTPIKFDLQSDWSAAPTHYVTQDENGDWELWLHAAPEEPIRYLNEFEVLFIESAFLAGYEFARRTGDALVP